MSSPLLSIVVPFYGVEAYIADCLHSLQNQTFTDFEVILIDDGSKDNSLAIAEEFVAKDPRIKLIRQENAGLGPARNTGTAHASGKYITYVDSDDVVAPRAYELMVGSLEHTGSDIAAGNALRFNRIIGFEQSWAHQWAFRHTRYRTHINEIPDLTYDRMVWNKVFRRSFYDDRGYAFPPIRYEDYPVTFPAHVEAGTVDVLRDHIYFWRIRESGDSITQQAFNLDNLTDRYVSDTAVLDQANLLGVTPSVRSRLNRLFIDVDLFALADGWAKAASSEDRNAVETMLVDFANRLDPEAGKGLQEATRLVHEAVLSGNLELAGAIATWRGTKQARPLLNQLRRTPHRAVAEAVAKAAAGSLSPKKLTTPRPLKAALVDAQVHDDQIHLSVEGFLTHRVVERASWKAWGRGARGTLPLTSDVEEITFPDGTPAWRMNITTPVEAIPSGESKTLMVAAQLGMARWRGAVQLSVGDDRPELVTTAEDGDLVYLRHTPGSDKTAALWRTSWARTATARVEGDNVVLVLDHPLGELDHLVVRRPDPSLDLILDGDGTTFTVPIRSLTDGEAIDNPVKGYADRPVVIRLGRVRPPTSGGDLAAAVPPRIPTYEDPTDPFGHKHRYHRWPTDAVVLVGDRVSAAVTSFNPLGEDLIMSLRNGTEGALVVRLSAAKSHKE